MGDSDGVEGEGRHGVNRIARLSSPSGRFPGVDIVPHHPSMDSDPITTPGMIPDMTWPTAPGCLSRPAGPCRRGARSQVPTGESPSFAGAIGPGLPGPWVISDEGGHRVPQPSRPPSVRR